MASKYKVIFRSDSKRSGANRATWIPGCPLLAEAVQIARNTETGQAFLQLKFVNVSRPVILSFKAHATVQYEDGSLEEIEIAPLDADMQPGGIYKPTAHQLKQGDALSAKVVIEQVVSEQITWERAGLDPLPLQVNETLTLSESERDERQRLLQEAGCTSPEAIDTKVLSENNWWICSCGALNVDRPECHACGMSTMQLTMLEDKAFLTESANNYALQQQEAEKARDARGKKVIAILVGIASVLIAILIAVALLNQPSLEDRLEAHTWQTTTTAKETDGTSHDVVVNTTFKDGTITFSWIGQTVSTASYTVKGGNSIEVNNLDGNAVSTTWNITFSNDDRTLTMESGGSKLVLKAVE